MFQFWRYCLYYAVQFCGEIPELVLNNSVQVWKAITAVLEWSFAGLIKYEQDAVVLYRPAFCYPLLNAPPTFTFIISDPNYSDLIPFKFTFLLFYEHRFNHHSDQVITLENFQAWSTPSY